MSLMAEIQELALAGSPVQLSAALLLAGGLVTSVCGFLRNGRAFRKQLPAVIFAVSAWMALIFERKDAMAKFLVTLFIVLSMFGLLLYVWNRRLKHYRYDFMISSFSLRPLIYLMPAFGMLCLLLLYDLENYVALPISWESPVIQRIADDLSRGLGTGDVLLRNLFWTPGLLGQSETSLLWGVPTYFLFQNYLISVWSMRIVSALAVMACFPVAYMFAKRFFGIVPGAVFCAVLTLSQPVYFYGRYGISPAVTLLALLIALHLCFNFLEEGKNRWWLAIPAALSLYIVSVNYAPARIVVCLLAVFVPCTAAKYWRPLFGKPLLAIVCFVAMVSSIVLAQVAAGHGAAFFEARGQQYFGMLQRPEYQSLGSRIELAFSLIRANLPGFLSLLAPWERPSDNPAVLVDPPQLQFYHAPLAVFLAWGMIHTIARWRSWQHLFFLLWVTVGGLPLLLSSHIDAHRAFFMVIPISLWIALGSQEAMRIMNVAKLPHVLRPMVPLVLCLSMSLDLLRALHNPDKINRTRLATEFISEVVDGIPGTVVVGGKFRNQTVSQLTLSFMERLKNDRSASIEVLSPRFERLLAEPDILAKPALFTDLLAFLGNRTLVLYPASNYPAFEAAGKHIGLQVSRQGGLVHNLFVAHKGHGLDPNNARLILASPRPAAPRKIPHAESVSLLSMKPGEIHYDYAPPEYHTQGGETGGLQHSNVRAEASTYKNAIGLVGNSSLRYELPPGSVGFIAALGLAERAKFCREASMTFKILDQNGSEIYYSGLVDALSPRRVVSVPFTGASIVLVSENGGNGDTCDFGFWGDPRVLFSAPGAKVELTPEPAPKKAPPAPQKG